MTHGKRGRRQRGIIKPRYHAGEEQIHWPPHHSYSICGLASGLVRELFNVNTLMNCTASHKFYSESTALASIEDVAGLDGYLDL